MIRRCVACIACVAAGAMSAAAQVVQFRTADSGIGPAILSRALAAPHVQIGPGTVARVIRAGTIVNRSVIALGRTVIVAGTIQGDVIVVGANLYIHPGGRIDGRAIAMGGGVYESMLAHTGTVTVFDDFTYDIAPISGGYALSYVALSGPIAVPAFTLGGFKGVEIPMYDRSNGLSLPLEMLIAVPHTPIHVEPSATYRSQLGRLDPSLGALAPLTRDVTARVDVGRGTFTNDGWIWSDLVNSAEYFLAGDDTRNYYRAARAQATVSGRWQSAASTLAPYVAARLERATSVRPDSNATGGPWALTDRRSRDDVLRRNPAIDPGTIFSVLVGAEWTGSTQGVNARGRIDEEVGSAPRLGASAPPSNTPPRALGSNFAQTTFDGAIAFPTFGLQQLRVEAHAVASLGSAPRQRWAYIGGPGTLPTLKLFERGGDRLIYVDARYDIPLVRVTLPLIGAPIVTLRETLGGAGSSGFPTLAQATGVRLSAGFVDLDILVDPVTRKRFVGAGLAFAR